MGEPTSYMPSGEEWLGRRTPGVEDFGGNDGSWLITAGKIPIGSGFFWLEGRRSLKDVFAALEKQYGEGAYDVSSHGERFYLWRNK